MVRSRRVTSLMLGDPAVCGGDSWLEFAPQDGVTLVSEAFARRRLPAAALSAMRTSPCFYICVDSIADTIASVPGRSVSEATVTGAMREVCVETSNGMVVLAEFA
jgi:hypothetical protein